MRSSTRVAAWLVVPLLVQYPSGAGAAPPSHRVVKGGLEATSETWVARESGAVVDLGDGVVLRLVSGSRLRPRPAVALPLGGAARTRTHSFVLESGSVLVKNPPASRGPGPAVLIELPGGFSAITAGGLLEATTDGSTSAVANREGTAWATPGGGGSTRRLGPGTGFQNSKGVAGSFTLAKAPELGAARRVFSGLTGGAQVDGLTWTAVPEARGYVVRLFQADSSAPLDVKRVQGLAQDRPFEAMPPGAYAVTVAAVDAHGIEGMLAKAVPLRVVGVTLPAGATVTSGGGVALPERAPLSFTHADGLLVALGPSPSFAPVSGPITLRNGEPTLVRLRAPEETTGVSFLLRPRKLSVSVAVGPKQLCWPGRSADVAIHASDAETGAAVPDLELHPVVTLGVETVPLTFQNEGGTLRAVVAAPSGAGPGPWVLRVQVNDQFGSAIGRDFVEIDRCAPKAAPRPKTAASKAPSQG